MKRIHRLLDRPEPPHAALTPAFSAGLILLTAAVALTAWQPNPQDQVRQQKAAAAAASPYHKWLTEDIAYIIEDRERAAFKALQTDEEREKFIEQFWLRRDPTPGTPQNEMKEEHYRRIAYTNAKYGDNTGLAGWKTDRGRVYITYGPPDEIESHPSGSATMPYPTEQWLYHHIQGVGENVIVEFVDQARNGLYRMTSDPAGPKVGNVVALNSLWPDTVKRGDMVRQVRGLGFLGPNGAVEVKFSSASIQELSMGKVANVDLRTSMASGRVARISPESGVTVQLDAPTNAAPGAQADVSVTLETLRDVVYVGRPVYATANSQGALFKLDPDGRTATLVPVRFGRTSVNQIEVVSGLAPGDRVILSDMTAYLGFGKVEIQ
jgi:GWxTD domain-containing protein